VLRTYCDALTTQTTLLEVDISEVVLYGDGTKVTLLLTFSTSDTAYLTGLHGYRALILVDTRDEDSPTLRTFLTELDDVTRTSLDTRTARGTLLFVDLRDTCLRINLDGIKLTGSLTVATSKTSEATGCLTGSTGVHRSTGAKSGILGNARTMLASTITSHYGYHRLGIGNSHSQQISNLTHRLGTTNGTHQSVEASGISTLDEGISHTATTWESTSSAVGTRKELSHLSYTGILIDSELLGGGKQHYRGYQADGS
jgi:hypothetical protein